MAVGLVCAIVAVVFLGALSRSTLGFGDAVVSMPLLALLPMPLSLAVALMGLVGVTIALVVVVTDWRHIDWQPLKPILLAVLCGVPLGLLVLRYTSQAMVTGILGWVLMAYGMFSLTRHFRSKGAAAAWVSGRGWPYLFGLVAGALGGAYNFNGIPVAVYGTLRQWPRERFRSTMQGYFLVSGSFVVAGQALNGMWNGELWILYAWSLPAMGGALVAGSYLRRKIPTGTFQPVVLSFIVLLGLLLVVKSIPALSV